MSHARSRSSRHGERRALQHNLSVYDRDADLGARAVPFLKPGTGAGEALFVVVDQLKWTMLRRGSDFGRSDGRVGPDASYKCPRGMSTNAPPVGMPTLSTAPSIFEPFDERPERLDAVAGAGVGPVAPGINAELAHQRPAHARRPDRLAHRMTRAAARNGRKTRAPYPAQPCPPESGVWLTIG
jgi:hypothetical protein